MTTLREALLALFPTTPHEGEAPSSATLPWTVASLYIPTASGRALAGAVHGRRVLLRVTVAADTHHGCWNRATGLSAALEGAVPIADGWTVAPLRLINARRVQRDTQVIIPGTNTAPFYTVLEFETTASATT